MTPASERMTAGGTGAGDPPGGSAGIAGAVLFGAVSLVLIVVAPHPHDTPHVRPGAAPSFESVPPVAAPESECDACDRICERCRELCGRDGTANHDRILERPPVCGDGDLTRPAEAAYSYRSASIGTVPNSRHSLSPR